jgi:hypothetical protein
VVGGGEERGDTVFPNQPRHMAQGNGSQQQLLDKLSKTRELESKLQLVGECIYLMVRQQYPNLAKKIVGVMLDHIANEIYTIEAMAKFAYDTDAVQKLVDESVQALRDNEDTGDMENLKKDLELQKSRQNPNQMHAHPPMGVNQLHPHPPTFNHPPLPQPMQGGHNHQPNPPFHRNHAHAISPGYQGHPHTPQRVQLAHVLPVPADGLQRVNPAAQTEIGRLRTKFKEIPVVQAPHSGGTGHNHLFDEDEHDRQLSLYRVEAEGAKDDYNQKLTVLWKHFNQGSGGAKGPVEWNLFSPDYKKADKLTNPVSIVTEGWYSATNVKFMDITWDQDDAVSRGTRAIHNIVENDLVNVAWPNLNDILREIRKRIQGSSDSANWGFRTVVFKTCEKDGDGKHVQDISPTICRSMVFHIKGRNDIVQTLVMGTVTVYERDGDNGRFILRSILFTSIPLMSLDPSNDFSPHAMLIRTKSNVQKIYWLGCKGYHVGLKNLYDSRHPLVYAQYDNRYDCRIPIPDMIMYKALLNRNSLEDTAQTWKVMGRLNRFCTAYSIDAGDYTDLFMVRSAFDYHGSVPSDAIVHGGFTVVASRNGTESYMIPKHLGTSTPIGGATGANGHPPANVKRDTPNEVKKGADIPSAASGNGGTPVKGAPRVNPQPTRNGNGGTPVKGTQHVNIQPTRNGINGMPNKRLDVKDTKVPPPTHNRNGNRVERGGDADGQREDLKVNDKNFPPMPLPAAGKVTTRNLVFTDVPVEMHGFDDDSFHAGDFMDSWTGGEYDDLFDDESMQAWDELDCLEKASTAGAHVWQCEPAAAQTHVSNQMQPLQHPSHARRHVSTRPVMYCN